MEILSILPHTLLQWAGALGVIVLGVFFILGIWDKKTKEKRKEVEGSSDRLVLILQETVDELEKKVNKQSKDIEVLGQKIEALEKENEILIKVLQGRDEKTQEFYAKAFPAIETLNKTFKIIERLENKLTNN